MEEQKQNSKVGGPQVQNSALDNKTVMGILCYVGPLVLIPILTEKEDKFIKFHIKQGLVLLILEVLLFVVAGSVWMLMPVIGIFQIGFLILSILGILNVVNKKEEPIPLIGQFSSQLDGIIK